MKLIIIFNETFISISVLSVSKLPLPFTRRNRFINCKQKLPNGKFHWSRPAPLAIFFHIYPERIVKDCKPSESKWNSLGFQLEQSWSLRRGSVICGLGADSCLPHCLIGNIRACRGLGI